MTNEEFIKLRKEEELKEKHKENIAILKDLLGNSFKNLPKRFAIETGNAGSYGDRRYSVDIETGKIEEEYDVCGGPTILLPNRDFNKHFFKYCVENKIF